MNHLESWLTQYETDVRFPDVSGMEHLDMLLTRSRLAAERDALSPEQAERLLTADQHLLQNAEPFYRAIASVGDLSAWRSQSAASPEEWWWYLDVLVSVPPLTVAN